MTSLFDPITVGAIDAPNRIMMAPLTRGRATHSHVPTPLMGEYYSQRASAGLIISEATGISQQGLGWPGSPGLWSEEQVTAWRPIVRAVHGAGGRIVAQLWHMGRLVHPDYLGGAPPVSASATTAPGNARTYEGTKPYAESRALGYTKLKRSSATINWRPSMRPRPVSMACSYTPRTAISSISFYATELTGAPIATAAPSKTVSGC
jgi:2,4-dienoyl-CoA reductase-like NADH-dependent reductase (Old Yellow Enzyme family)